MRNRLQFPLVLIAACTCLHPPVPAAGNRTDRLRADIEFLSSQALEGRASLSRGAQITAEFIAAEFRKAGLGPGNGKSYFQEFQASPVRLDPDRAALRISRDGKEQRIAVSSVSFSDPLHPVDISGNVVFAGFGITAQELQYDDYAGIDAQGKVVLVLDNEPRKSDPASPFNGTGLTIYAGPWYKAWNAQRHGAAAVLMAAGPLETHRPAPREPGRASAPSQALVEGELRIPYFRINTDVLQELLAGSGKSPAQWQQEIEDTLKPASRGLTGLSVRLEAANQEPQPSISLNVAGIIEGADRQKKTETIILCAHYDHLGSHNGRVCPGANDNATGVAALMEVARRFTEEGWRPRRSVLFIAFGSEEQTMLGSYHYAANPLRTLAGTRSVINLDMIGRNEEHTGESRGAYEVGADTSNELNLVAAVYSPQLAALVARQNRKVGLKLNDKFDRDWSMRALFRCDHLPFLCKNVPAIWFFGGFHPGYHTPDDTTDKIDYTKLEKVTQLALLTVKAAAD